MSSSKNPRRVRFGLNYVPSKRWYYCWNDWNPAEIAEDFDAIAKLGADHIRVMLVWPYFQPNPAQVSAVHLKRLGELMAAAQKRDLDVIVCPLTGWLSGFRFLPSAIYEPESIFLEERIGIQVRTYFQGIIDAVGGCRNFFGFDLGNEINVMVPFLPQQAGDKWGRELVAWLRPKVPDKWIVNGVDNHPWFTGRTFSTTHLVQEYDAVAVHAWPMFTACLKRGALDEAPSCHLSAFLTHLCRHAMSEAGTERPIWIQEFGCSGLWGTEKSKEVYLRESVRHAVHAGATWFTWWCSHDIDRSYQFDELEYDLGLLNTDNSEKPLAKVFRELVEIHAEPQVQLEEIYSGFGAQFTPAITKQLPGSQWLEQNLETTTWKVFDRYLEGKVSSLGVLDLRLSS